MSVYSATRSGVRETQAEAPCFTEIPTTQDKHGAWCFWMNVQVVRCAMQGRWHAANNGEGSCYNNQQDLGVYSAVKNSCLLQPLDVMPIGLPARHDVQDTLAAQAQRLP